MKKNVLISFAFTVIMFVILRLQGAALVTPQSPHGILDLEFAKTPQRLFSLRLFWNVQDVLKNIILDFAFIVAYVWFFISASKLAANRFSDAAISAAVAAGAFDICENFLMMLAIGGRFNGVVLYVVYYCATVKFILAGMVVIYLLVSLVSSLFRKGS